MSGVRAPPRRLWPKLKWTTRRVVIPEEAGSAGHPIAHAKREIWRSARFHMPRVAGSIPAPATNARSRSPTGRGTAFRPRSVRVRLSPSRPPFQCELVDWEPRLALNQEDRVRDLGSQPSRTMPVRLSPSPVSCEGRAFFCGVKGLTASPFESAPLVRRVL